MTLIPELVLTDVSAIDSISSLARVTCEDDIEFWGIEGDPREYLFRAKRAKSPIETVTLIV